MSEAGLSRWYGVSDSVSASEPLPPNSFNLTALYKAWRYALDWDEHVAHQGEAKCPVHRL